MSSLLKATWFSGLTSLVNVFSQILKGKAQAVFLGTSGMGVLSQVIYFFNLANIVAGLGLSEGVVRFTREYSASEKKDKLQSFHITIFSILLCSAVGISVVAMFLSDHFSIALFGNNKNSKYVMLVIAAVPFAIIARFFNSILRGLREVKTVSKVSVYANLFTLPAAVILTYLYQITGAIIGLVLLHATSLVVGYFFVFQGNLFNLKKFSLKHIDLKFFSINKWYSLTSLLMVIMSNLTLIYVSRLIITNMGIDQNGIYAVTVKVSSVYFGMLLGAASTYYYPTLCGLNDPDAISAEINNTLHYYVVILTPVIIGLISFNQLIVSALFSPKFLLSGTLLAYHLPGDMLRIAYETMGLSLLAKGRLKVYVCLYAIWCLLYIVLAKQLGQAMGLAGLSSAYTLSFLIVMGLAYMSIFHVFGFKMAQKTVVYLSLSLACVTCASLANILVSSDLKYLLGSVILIFWIALVFRDPAFKRGLKRILKKGEKK